MKNLTLDELGITRVERTSQELQGTLTDLAQIHKKRMEKMELYDPNKLEHNEVAHAISEWQEFNDLANERDWHEVDDFVGGCLSCKELPPEVVDNLEE